VSQQDTNPTRPSWVGTVMVGAIRVYQRWISPALGPRCRFYPSCSEYALQAIKVHGAARGTWLAARRLVKCQPLHPGGIDHVPPATGRSRARRSARAAAAPARPSERGSL
jgi:uncharacterized protein